MDQSLQFTRSEWERPRRVNRSELICKRAAPSWTTKVRRWVAPVASLETCTRAKHPLETVHVSLAPLVGPHMGSADEVD